MQNTKNEKNFSKILYVILGNFIKLTTSIAIAFLIPDILGLTDYGFYKVFLLYVTYIGFFQFGFVDGIYLKYGGTDYDDLCNENFRAFFRFYLIFQLSIVFGGFIVVNLFLKGDRQFIFNLLMINLFLLNLTAYFQFVSQITSRFREYSNRLIVYSVGNLFSVGIMFFFRLDSYKIFISLLLSVNLLILIWYVYTYRKIVFGNITKFMFIQSDLVSNFKKGIPLLLANFSATLMLTVDKQVVELFFPVDDFAIYSFAYSMLVIITAFISAISITIYPLLKKIQMEKLHIFYDKYDSLIIILVCIGMIGYFPLKFLIPTVLPDYASSLSIFRIVMPALIFTSSVSTIKHNIIKVLDKNNQFFYITLISVVITVSLNLVAYFYFGSLVGISASTVFGIFIWYALTEIYINKKLKTKWLSKLIIAVFSMLIFYTSTLIDNIFISGFLYVLWSILLLGLLYRIVRVEI